MAKTGKGQGADPDSIALKALVASFFFFFYALSVSFTDAVSQARSCGVNFLWGLRRQSVFVSCLVTRDLAASREAWHPHSALMASAKQRVPLESLPQPFIPIPKTPSRLLSH